MRGVSTPSTLMPTGMRVTNPKLSKGGRKLKMTKHCTISETLNIDENKRAFETRTKSGKKKMPQWKVCKLLHQNKFWGA